jgi:hypothetical protein
MKTKLRLDHFDRAAEFIETGSKSSFACNALSAAGDPKGYGYRNDGWIKTPERTFFEELFGLYAPPLSFSGTFTGMCGHFFGYYPGEEEIRDIRVLALCFAREIARCKNRGK